MKIGKSAAKKIGAAQGKVAKAATKRTQAKKK